MIHAQQMGLSWFSPIFCELRGTCPWQETRAQPALGAEGGGPVFRETGSCLALGGCLACNEAQKRTRTCSGCFSCPKRRQGKMLHT